MNVTHVSNAGKFAGALVATLWAVAAVHAVEPRPLGTTVVSEHAQATRPGQVTRSQLVSYADLDVSRPAGAEVLYRRLGWAARKVCEPAAARDLSARREWQQCHAAALDAAVAAVDNPYLTGQHMARSGRPLPTGALVAREQ